jgi:hypothetical protein
MKKACSIIAALLMSLFIYVFYRSEKTVVNELIILIISFDTYTTIKSIITNTIPLNETIIFSLPGGLWVYCATALSHDFYLEIRKYRIQFIVVPISFAIGLEFCQLIHFTNGTFDIWDIAFYKIFWLISYYSSRCYGLQQNILSPFTLPGFICLACFLSVYLAHVSQ